MDVTKVVLPALIVPILLIVAVTVYMSTTDSTSFTFENAVSLEATGITGNNAVQTFSSAYDCKKDSVTLVKNGTTVCTTPTCYNVTYVPLAPCEFSQKSTAGAVVISYTAYSGDGYEAFDKMNTQSFAGFKLASMLPFVLIAMVVITLVIGALVFA